jgi:hypothetical protein
LKEKTLKILLGILYFGIFNLEVSIASDIDDDKIDHLKSESCTPPKAPHFRQVSRRFCYQANQFPRQVTGQLGRQGVKPLLHQVTGKLSPPIEDASKASISVGQSLIHRLLPRQVINMLRQLKKNGTINKNTLVVWDIDDTLWKGGSDLRGSGPRPIHPDFSKFIRATQAKGTIHIALTNGGARYRTQLRQDDEEIWMVTDITPIDFSVADSDGRGKEGCFIPSYLRPQFKDTDRVSWEFLRIAGLERIGISFEKAFEESEFLKPRHVLGILKERNQPFCVPVFISGVIMSNFVDSHVHLCRYRKGDILRLFLEECKEKDNRIFSNVIFIDDTLPCVENVVEVMKKIGMPCIGINILHAEE